MLRSAVCGVALCWALLVAAAPAPAADEADERIARLEARVQQLETALGDAGALRAAEARHAGTSRHWTDRVRLSGSASTGYFHHGDLTPGETDGFRIHDARLFVDAELFTADAPDPLVRNVGFTFEWNLVRLGTLANDIGDLFVEFQALRGRPWLNAQVGRFQIPVGEAYLRYGRGAAANPFTNNPVGGPWWWDEGLRLYGAVADDRVGYVASVTNADTPWNGSGDDPQGTLKLYGRPVPWLMLSASGLVSGASAGGGGAANGALWLGETWARAVGNGTPVPSVVDGAIVAPDAARFDRTWLVAADAVATPLRGLRAWLGWGRYAIESRGPGLYDRALTYWIAELLVDGDLAWDALAPLYLGVRSSGLTTGDPARGYLLDVRYTSSFGYNMESLLEHSLVVGWRIRPGVVLRGQYDLREFDLVRGAAAAVTASDADVHAFSLDVGVSF